MSAPVEAPRRRWLHRLGAALSLLALAWIVWRFARDLNHAPQLRLLLDAALAWRVLAASLLYALGLGLLVLAWHRLLVALAGHTLPPRIVGSSYATSQFGKYLPGNVAHYVLRHASLRTLGLPHSLLLAAGMLEALALVLAAALWTTLLLGADAWRLLAGTAAAHGGGLQRAAVVAALLVLAAMAWGLLRWRRHGVWRERVRHWRLRLPSARALLSVLLLHLLFFAMMAACLWLLASALPDTPAWPRLAGATTASWLGGYLVPGAPAGLGIREVLLVGLLHGAWPGGQSLLLAVAFRVATFLGDLWLFAIGAWCWRRAR